MYILPGEYFKTVFEWLRLTWEFALISFFSMAIFLNTDISQGSLATCLR